MPGQLTTASDSGKDRRDDSQRQAQRLSQKLQAFVDPLLERLDAMLDRRLVRTFAETVGAILRFRDTTRGLLLSELGAWLASPAHAPAGTKRLSNLLRSKKWSLKPIEEFLWQQGSDRLEELQQSQQPAVAIWDHSVWEKPESIAIEGLCGVRSQKARRLARRRPGFRDHGPYPKVVVPGMQWLGLLVTGLSGAVTLAAMCWWTTHGERASHAIEHQRTLLHTAMQCWGATVLHLFDRGFAGAPWLAVLSEERSDGLAARFITRWQKPYPLQRLDGTAMRCSRLMQGKRAWGRRWLSDEHGNRCAMYLTAMQLVHPEYAGQLWLVRCRAGKHREPWYLLTNEPVETLKQAFAIARAYLRRWQIELTWRYSKSELAIQSPRLWFWENRLKLLMIVALCYSFLLSLLRADFSAERSWLLQRWCHRTGARVRRAVQPLYRLRTALSRLWIAFEPALGWPVPQTPG